MRRRAVIEIGASIDEKEVRTLGTNDEALRAPEKKVIAAIPGDASCTKEVRASARLGERLG
jgi:hypothetical protein